MQVAQPFNKRPKARGARRNSPRPAPRFYSSRCHAVRPLRLYCPPFNGILAPLARTHAAFLVFNTRVVPLTFFLQVPAWAS